MKHYAQSTLPVHTAGRNDADSDTNAMKLDILSLTTLLAANTQIDCRIALTTRNAWQIPAYSRPA